MQKFDPKSIQPKEDPKPNPADIPSPIERKKSRIVKPIIDKQSQNIRIKSGVDRPFLIIVIILLCIGTTMVFSASYVYAKYNFAGDSYYFAKQQIKWAVISLVGLLVASNFDYLILKRFTKLFLIVSLIALALVPIIGYQVNGAKRWINLGFTNLQPSELVKAAIVFYFADYIVKNQAKMKTFKYGILPYALFAVVICGLLVLQPHLSAMVIILLLLFVMMFLGGTNGKHLGLLALIASAGMAAIMLLTTHGNQRIQIWLQPELDPSGAGWQPLHSLYAIGYGGLWGLGLGESRQKHLFLPEPQNDYIFSILCEEMGFVFAAMVIILFVLLIWRGFYIARNSPSSYTALVVYGLITQIAIQVILNIAVVTNTIPSTGVSLPFFSYGGSSLIICMAEMGVVLNISKYSYLKRE